MPWYAAVRGDRAVPGWGFAAFTSRSGHDDEVVEDVKEWGEVKLDRRR